MEMSRRSPRMSRALLGSRTDRAEKKNAVSDSVSLCPALSFVTAFVSLRVSFFFGRAPPGRRCSAAVFLAFAIFIHA